MKNEYNFFWSDNEADKDLFFGPLENESFIGIKEEWTMANILVLSGIFKSIREAKSSGYFKPIPKGFTDLKMGKNKTRITILNNR